MKIRKFIYYSFSIMIAMAAIIACQDEFNEEEFLKQQQDAALALQQAEAKADSALAAQGHQYQMEYLNQVLANGLAEDEAERAAQMVALNEAGMLLSYTLLVQEDRVPVPGVTVILTNAGAGSTETVTTDANGAAIFNNVPIGANSVIISATGYMTASFIVDSGSPSWSTVNGIIIPEIRTESNIVPIFSTSGSTAVIKGKVDIQTDLTNNTPEIPQSTVVIQAVVTVSNEEILSGNSGYTSNIIGYSIDFGDVGTATVDPATGEYSITVPANADGDVDISLTIPNIEENQKLAVEKLDGQEITPEYRDVPTFFGPDAVEDAITNVFGIKAVNSYDPSAAGLGFNFTATKKPRGLGTWTRANPSEPFEMSNVDYKMTNRGSGYSGSPTITISDGGATSDAKMKASLKGYFTGITNYNKGTGYTPTETVTVKIGYFDNDDVFHSMTNITGATVTVEADGTLPDIEIGDFLLYVGSDNLFKTENIDATGYQVANFAIQFGTAMTDPATLATASVTVVASVNAIKMTDGGEGYTSAPTITFTGGTTNAVLEIEEIRFQWWLDVDNSGNTEPYNVMPDDIDYQYEDEGFYIDNDMRDQFDGFNTDISNLLEVEGGNIVWKDETKQYYTEKYSTVAPTALVEQATITLYKWDLELSDGELNSFDDEVSGKGYDNSFTVSIEPAITGAPGSGAEVYLTWNYVENTNEWVLNNEWITNPGSGYLENLNVQGTIINYAGSADIIGAKPGQTYVRDIHYGTGDKQEDVN